MSDLICAKNALDVLVKQHLCVYTTGQRGIIFSDICESPSKYCFLTIKVRTEEKTVQFSTFEELLGFFMVPAVHKEGSGSSSLDLTFVWYVCCRFILKLTFIKR